MRLEGLKADRVQAVDDQLAPPVVFGEHPLDIGLAVRQRLQRRVLRHRGRRHDRVLVDLHDRLRDAAGAASQPRRQPVIA